MKERGERERADLSLRLELDAHRFHRNIWAAQGGVFTVAGAAAAALIDVGFGCLLLGVSAWLHGMWVWRVWLMRVNVRRRGALRAAEAAQLSSVVTGSLRGAVERATETRRRSSVGSAGAR